MTKIPTGIIGPLLVQGVYAKGDFYVPMATSEGALISSYLRGAKATRESRGVVAICLLYAIQRAPSFKFQTLNEASSFGIWALEQVSVFKEIVKTTSRFAILQDLKINIEGNVAILIFEYSTGEAAGQNMVTISTNAICNYIIENCPTKPQHWFIEGNFSGDKKATVAALNHVRGKKVSAEAIISKKVIQNVLNTNAATIVQYWITSVIGTVQSGGIGLQGHFANGLAAMFLATGQDVACVAEASNGITRMEVLPNDDLYISVSLPSLVVGTIGGGTWLPTQKECLDVLGCSGPVSAKKLAEIMAANILGGELSIAAAMASHDFTRAHKNLGRNRFK
jgi:hydroxymethylglutaryl-CoA reductase (NADPH)